MLFLLDCPNLYYEAKKEGWKIHYAKLLESAQDWIDELYPDKHVTLEPVAFVSNIDKVNPFASYLKEIGCEVVLNTGHLIQLYVNLTIRAMKIQGPYLLGSDNRVLSELVHETRPLIYSVRGYDISKDLMQKFMVKEDVALTNKKRNPND